MVSKAQRKATEKYEKSHYFKTLVRFPADLEEEIRAQAGESLNGFIVSAVLEKIGKEKPERKQEEKTEKDHEPERKQDTAPDVKEAIEKRVSEYRATLERLRYSDQYIQSEIDRLRNKLYNENK